MALRSALLVLMMTASVPAFSCSQMQAVTTAKEAAKKFLRENNVHAVRFGGFDCDEKMCEQRFSYGHSQGIFNDQDYDGIVRLDRASCLPYLTSSASVDPVETTDTSR